MMSLVLEFNTRSASYSRFRERFHKLVTFIFGQNGEVDESLESLSFEERLDGFMDLVMDLFLQDFKRFKPLVMRLVHLSCELLSDQNEAGMASVLTSNIDMMSDIFGVNPQLLEGFVGILSGDFHALAVMAAPIADISPDAIAQLMSFIKEIRGVLSSYIRRRKTLALKMESQRGAREQYRDISQKIKEGKGSYEELFLLVDQEGDGNGSIGKSEFRTMAWRLQIKLSDHRIDELFAAAASQRKRGASKREIELNQREFKEAMKYIELKSSRSAL